MAGRPAEQRFLVAVDQIYATATEGTGWEPAIASALDFIGAQAADLNFFDKQRRHVTRMETARVDLNAVQRYVVNMGDDLIHRNPRMENVFFKIGEGECAADSDVWNVRQRRNNPFFEELRRTASIHDGLCSWVAKNEHASIALFVHLGPAQTEPDAEVRMRLRMLLPHLRRACAVEEKLLSARREAGALATTLDHVAEAVALIDACGRIVKANDRALRLFRPGDGLSLAVDERLVLSRPETRETFARALAQCASPLMLLDEQGAPPPAQITVFRRELRPLVLTLQPLPTELKGAYGAVAMLFISDPDAQPADSTAALRAAYRLSGTEARLVQALGEGQSLREFAASNTMSYETVRSHIRRIFMKTGARRQSDLVRITRNLR